MGRKLHVHFTTDGISQLHTTRNTLLLRREVTPVPPSSGGLILLWRSPSWSLHRCVRQYLTQVGCRLLSQLMPVGLPLVAKQSRANERILVKSATRKTLLTGSTSADGHNAIWISNHQRVHAPLHSCYTCTWHRQPHEAGKAFTRIQRVHSGIVYAITLPEDWVLCNMQSLWQRVEYCLCRQYGRGLDTVYAVSLEES